MRLRLAPIGLTALLFLVGMGGMGGDEGEIEVPDTEQDFGVTVLDDTQTSTSLSHFSWDGFTHVQGKLGSGVVAIPFAKVKQIDVKPGPDKSTMNVRVTLREGEAQSLTVDSKLTCYGKTSFGNYRVALKNLSRVTFTSRPPKE